MSILTNPWFWFLLALANVARYQWCKQKKKAKPSDSAAQEDTGLRAQDIMINYGNGLFRHIDTPQHFICKLSEDKYIISSAYPIKQTEVQEFDSLATSLAYCHVKLRNNGESATGLMGSNQLRPLMLDKFIGQEKLKKTLRRNISACKNGAMMPHCLFEGNAGLGKTTLAGILANELNVKCHSITAPAIRSRQDLVKTILEVKEGDILFIDEVHRLRTDIEELLYPVMEDFKMDLTVGYGETKQLKQIQLPKFTLIGATTIAGKINKPLRNRFKKNIKVEFYTQAELAQVIRQNSIKIGVELTEDAALEVAKRARGTPRIANNLMEDVIIYAKGDGLSVADKKCAQDTFEEAEIDSLGLTSQDKRVLRVVAENHAGKAIGINSLAATANEDRDTIAEAIEPFLLRLGLIKRTAQGRIITDRGMEALA